MDFVLLRRRLTQSGGGIFCYEISSQTPPVTRGHSYSGGEKKSGGVLWNRSGCCTFCPTYFFLGKEGERRVKGPKHGLLGFSFLPLCRHQCGVTFSSLFVRCKASLLGSGWGRRLWASCDPWKEEEEGGGFIGSRAPRKRKV